MTYPTRPASERRHDIDNLRNLAVYLLIVFHTARLFNDEAWHIKDAGVYGWADQIVSIIHQFHMPLFFLLAGFSAYVAIEAKGLGWFTRERFLRLFIPLVLGMILIVPPQIYVERISSFVSMRYVNADFSGSYADFLPTIFNTGAYPKGNLSWHHLWFVCYLFVYSVLLAPGLALLRGRSAVTALGAGLARYGLFLILPSALIVAHRLTLARMSPETHNLVSDWGAHAHFIGIFLAGWLMAASPELMTSIRNLRAISLGLAVLTFLLVRLNLMGPLMATPEDAALVRRIAYGAGEWLWMMTFVGYGQVLLNRRIPYVTGFTRYAFPFYILHQTVIVLLGYALYDWQSLPVLKFLTVCVLSAALSLAGCVVLDQTALTRFIVGMKAVRRVRTGPVAAAARA